MSTNVEPAGYIDPQAQVPVEFCSACGGEIYAPNGICLRCERRRS